MKIIPNDLKRQYELHADEYEQTALRILRKGWYVLGNEVASFEKEFAQYIGSRYCVGLASGLDALWMSFRLLGIGAGDEVIVSANAYIACVMGITINGATPIFVEPDEYLNIDAAKTESAITDKTKAILAVHLFGQSCDMDLIMAIANQHHLYVVEDCAQSHGNRWKEKRTGSFGDVACFSFYPSKGCGAFGDAGAIVTNREELADKFRVYRNYGSRVRYDFEVVGTNSRLDELQAGLLRIKLQYLDELNRERGEIAAKYRERITNPLIVHPEVRPRADSSWHQYVIRCKQRDALSAFLSDLEIGSIIHYPIPPHLSQAYKYLGYGRGDFPIAEKQADEVLSLPMFNGMTEKEITFVADAINAFQG